MNPNLELEYVILETIQGYRGALDRDDLSTELYRNIRNWMDRNQIVFYQP